MHINLKEKWTHAGRIELFDFPSWTLLQIYEYFVSFALELSLPLVNSTLSFISYLKYQQLIWEAFLQGLKQS